MARVAICPHCDHELLVPDDAQSEAWAKCPDCRASFQLNQATVRALPALLLVDEKPPSADKLASPTVADIATAVTWQDSAIMDRDTLPEPELQLDEPDAPGSTAARIDEWFRTTKAASETGESSEAPESAASSPEQSEADVEIEADDELQFDDELKLDDEPRLHDELADTAASSTTIDLGSGGMDFPDTKIDFELAEPAAPIEGKAAWDDSQHMERLLADIETKPSETYSTINSIAVDFDEERMADEDTAADESNSESSIDVTPEGLAARSNAVRRKRSLVRTLVMTAVSAVVGLGLGYYALLWILGPPGDFMGIAQNIPSAILPGSFKPATPHIAPAPPATSIAAIAEEAQNEPPEEAPEQPAEERAEIQAGYTTTEEETPTAPPASDTDDRYAVTNNSAEAIPEEPAPLAEPAPLETPPANELINVAPPSTNELTTSPPTAAAAGLANAPSFTAADLSTALDAAKQAQSQLVDGNLSDSREVARAKGYGYSMLADLAQKATFVEGGATDPLQQDVEQLFKQTLSDPHTQSEVARILPKWIAAPSRKHGGVFFAGSIAGQENKGDVIECRVEVEGGQPVTVLVPETAADRLAESALPVGIVGYIVDDASTQVTGYSGTATQAIWASKLIPLQ